MDVIKCWDVEIQWVEGRSNMVQKKVLRVGANYRAVLRLYGINLPLSEPHTSNLVCPLVFSHTSGSGLKYAWLHMPFQADKAWTAGQRKLYYDIKTYIFSDWMKINFLIYKDDRWGRGRLRKPLAVFKMLKNSSADLWQLVKTKNTWPSFW